METSRWRCDERAAEAAGANAPAEEEEEFGDGHEKEYEEEYEEDGSDGRAHTPLCSKLRDAVDHAGLNDFMRVILEPLEEVFHGAAAGKSPSPPSPTAASTSAFPKGER